MRKNDSMAARILPPREGASRIRMQKFASESDACGNGYLEEWLLLGCGGQSSSRGIGCGLRQGQSQPEGCAMSGYGFKIDTAIMPLQDLIGLRKADATALGLGGEVEFEDLVLYFRRNSFSGVGDFGSDQPV